MTFHQKKVGDREDRELIRTLEHDFIYYPHELAISMQHLWINADSEVMTVEEVEQN